MILQSRPGCTEAGAVLDHLALEGDGDEEDEGVGRRPDEGKAGWRDGGMARTGENGTDDGQ